MILLSILLQTPTDTAYWKNFAERIAEKIVKDGGKDAIYDIMYVRDSTGKYILYYKRFIYTTPSGYKIFYRTPVAIKLPENSPDNIDMLIMGYLEKKQFTKENLLEMVSIGLGCGIVTMGALISLLLGMRR
ncbi:MAG: hypothetical protein ABIL67_08555 [candidate division WOR-3 bacterium]